MDGKRDSFGMTTEFYSKLLFGYVASLTHNPMGSDVADLICNPVGWEFVDDAVEGRVIPQWKQKEGI